jgi:fatty acid desaturase
MADGKQASKWAFWLRHYTPVFAAGLAVFGVGWWQTWTVVMVAGVVIAWVGVVLTFVHHWRDVRRINERLNGGR